MRGKDSRRTESDDYCAFGVDVTARAVAARLVVVRRAGRLSAHMNMKMVD